MAGASAQRRAPPGQPGQWFEKPAASPVDKIPAFREALAEVARAWHERFATLAGTEAEIRVDGVVVAKVDDILGRRSGPSVLSILEAPGWNAQVGLSFDRTFVTTLIEAMFGGDGEEIAAAASMPFSPVDLQIAEVVARQVAEALTAGFSERLPSSFKTGGLQWARLNPSFLGKPAASVVIGTLAMAALGHVVKLDVLVPLAAMMVFADELATESDTGPSFEDPRWAQRLETEVSRAAMRLTAAVDLTPMTLGAIAALCEGQLIELPRGASQRVRLLCGVDDLFRCDLGQSEGHYTLRVEEALGAMDGAGGAVPEGSR